MRWSFDVDAGEVTVEGRYAFRLLAPLLWHIPPEGKGPALFCRAYKEPDVDEQAYVGFVDVTNDADEPWVSQIRTGADIAACDDQLRRDTERLLPPDGRRLVRWMGTHYQPRLGVHSLLTAYIATDTVGDRQYADLRFQDEDRKLILATCWNVEEAEALAGPIFSTVATLRFLTMKADLTP